MDAWPDVLDEFQTIKLLQEQYSLARMGDGEIKLAAGAGYVREPPNEALAAELCAILTYPHERCLVGIPRIFKQSPKYSNWVSRIPQFLPFLSPNVHYVSAFVSRPDSAPAIMTIEYAEAVQKMWAHKKVTLLSEPSNSLATLIPRTARKYTHVPAPHDHAYAHIGRLEKACLRGAPDVVILSAGPTATCLASRLAARGVQAIDLGSAGGFLLRLLPPDRLPPLYPVVLSHPGCVDVAAVRQRLEASGFQVHSHGEKG